MSWSDLIILVTLIMVTGSAVALVVGTFALMFMAISDLIECWGSR